MKEERNKGYVSALFHHTSFPPYSDHTFTTSTPKSYLTFFLPSADFDQFRFNLLSYYPNSYHTFTPLSHRIQFHL